MWRKGRPISRRGNYILGKQPSYLYNVDIKEPIMSTDHQMILDDIKGEGVRLNHRYHKV